MGSVPCPPATRYSASSASGEPGWIDLRTQGPGARRRRHPARTASGAQRVGVEVVRTYDRLVSVRAAYDRLFQASPTRDVFLSWEWIETWWRHRGSSHQLRLLLLWDGEGLRGALPLMRNRTGIAGRFARVLTTIGVPSPDVGGVLVRGDAAPVLRTFGAHLATRLADWDVLDIREVAVERTPPEPFLEAFPDRSFRVGTTTTEHAHLPISGSWDAHWRRASANLRKDLRRRRNRLEERGGFTFQRFSGANVAPEHMAWVFSINERARYPEKYGSPEDQAYHRDLVAATSARGWADVCFLFVGGKPVAYRYGFQRDGVYEDWRTGFDLAFSELSVGKVLLVRLLQDCFDKGVREFDFLVGEEQYKDRLTTHKRPYAKLLIVRRRLPSVLTHAWVPRLKTAARRWWPGIRRGTPGVRERPVADGASHPRD